MRSQQGKDSSEQFLTAAEVAARYRISVRTVHNWLDRGQIPGVRIGKVVRFRFDDLIEAVEKHHPALVRNLTS